MSTPAERGGATGPLVALLSAVTYGVATPFSKSLESQVGPSTASALLYLGAGLAMALVAVLRAGRRTDREGPVRDGRPLARRDAPMLALMVALNAMSGVALLAGIFLSDAASAALLGNFEVVVTAALALLILHEPVSTTTWVALALVTASSLLLAWEPGAALALAPGSALVLLACVLWGLENVCTRALSGCDVIMTTLVKGLGTATACGLLAVVLGDEAPGARAALALVAIGTVSYGVSIMLYILGQRLIGAARTGVIFSAAPFVGVAVSWAMFGVVDGWAFWAALVLAVLGVGLTALDAMRG